MAVYVAPGVSVSLTEYSMWKPPARWSQIDEDSLEVYNFTTMTEIRKVIGGDNIKDFEITNQCYVLRVSCPEDMLLIKLTVKQY